LQNRIQIIEVFIPRTKGTGATLFVQSVVNRLVGEEKADGPGEFIRVVLIDLVCAPSEQ